MRHLQEAPFGSSTQPAGHVWALGPLHPGVVPGVRGTHTKSEILKKKRLKNGDFTNLS